MYRYLPNQLTILRLVLAGVFFIVLNIFRYEGPELTAHKWVLWASLALFVAAALTDALDGYLARRWKVESQFGRIMDPFCDKVLVIGAFVYLAGPRFHIPDGLVEAHHLNYFFNMISGVYPWMVVVILARELLVTSVRGRMEGQGAPFGAKLFGKLKMILQSVAIPTVLVIVWLDPLAAGHGWMGWVRDVLVYATVIVTILSGLPYILSARHALRMDPDNPP